MELIDKKKIYKKIKQIEQKYHEICSNDMDRSTYRTYQRFLADLANIRDFIENVDADITINDKIFKDKEKHKCVQCGRPVDTPFSICNECREEATQQREEYIQYCIKEASKIEKQ